MNIAIIGFDRQGRDAYDYWNKPGNTIVICDQNSNLSVPSNAKHNLGQHYLDNLHKYDLILRTPGLHPRQITDANPEHPEVLHKVWSVTNEFLKVCPTKNIIGVTGTKGKGTTSTLIAKMLEAAGKKVHLGGNIGISPLQLLKNDIQPDDWVVLELANFQLIDLKFSPPIAVCLMVEPEHMDWHTDMDEYLAAKQQLFVHQIPTDTAIYYGNNSNSRQVAAVSKGNHLAYMTDQGAQVNDNAFVIDGQTICKTNEVKLLGKHNWQNICAAITATWPIIQAGNPIAQVLQSFSGLPYRLEKVATINEISFFNDSFGTTPETAQVAVEAISAPKVLILGGSSKGSDYTALANTIKANNVRHVILIGDTAATIKSALAGAGYIRTASGGSSMEEIVRTAKEYALPGDAIVLSTACASFDMFNNYQDRGEQFNEVVKSL